MRVGHRAPSRAATPTASTSRPGRELVGVRASAPVAAGVVVDHERQTERGDCLELVGGPAPIHADQHHQQVRARRRPTRRAVSELSRRWPGPRHGTRHAPAPSRVAATTAARSSSSRSVTSPSAQVEDVDHAAPASATAPPSAAWPSRSRWPSPCIAVGTATWKAARAVGVPMAPTVARRRSEPPPAPRAVPVASDARPRRHQELPCRRDRVPRPRAALAGASARVGARRRSSSSPGTTAMVPSAIDAVEPAGHPGTRRSRSTRWAIATFGTSDIAVLNAGTTVIALLDRCRRPASLARRRPGVGRPAVRRLRGARAGRVPRRARLVVPARAPDVATGAGVGGLDACAGLLAPLGGRRPGRAVHRARARRPRLDSSRGFLAAAGGVRRGCRASLTGIGTVPAAGPLAVVDPRRGRAADTGPCAADAARRDQLRRRGPVAAVRPPTTPSTSSTRPSRSPQIDPTTWSLRIHGLVDREVVADATTTCSRGRCEEVDVTLACVSNEVGGDLVGNARWLGARLADLLDEAGRPAGCRAGRSGGRPTGSPRVPDRGRARRARRDRGRRDERRAAADAARLPRAAGGPRPVRLRVRHQVADRDRADHLGRRRVLDPRGWAKEGPIKTQSRIDVPAPRRTVAGRRGRSSPASRGRRPRGIDARRGRVDGGDWVAAELRRRRSRRAPGSSGGAVSRSATGDHVVQVRATDGDGRRQAPSRPAPPAPDGAEGWHRADVPGDLTARSVGQRASTGRDAC